MKKITALILVLVMILPLAFAACDNGKKPGPTPGGDNAASTGDKSTEENKNPTGSKEPEETEDPNKPYEYVPDPEGKYKGVFGVGTKGASVEFASYEVRNGKDDHELVVNDFTGEKPLDGWTFATAVGGNWDGDQADFVVGPADVEKDPKTVLSFKDTASTGAMGYFGDSLWNTVRLTIRPRVIEWGNGVVIYFCVKDKDNYMELVIGDKEGKYITVNSVTGGTLKQEGTIIIDLAKIELGKQFPVGINVNKDNIDVFVNGKKMFNVYGEEKPITGGIGVGSWNTANSFDNIKVTSNVDGSVLWQNDFSNVSDLTTLFMPKQYGSTNADHKTAIESDLTVNWSVVDGVLMNTGLYEGNNLLLTESRGNTEWQNYTLELDARIDGEGQEGWLIYVGVMDDKNAIMWNVGGWANSKTCFQAIVDGTKGNGDGSDCITSKYEVGQWYHLKIVVNPTYVLTYVDGELANTYMPG